MGGRSSRSARPAGATREAARKASYDNCEGWTGMLCAMRVWLEHGINLREGFYK